jgi:serine/threonine protein phosphatase PrpC
VARGASIVGAAETSVGKVREHNEDAHFIDTDRGIFVVCDGMGGHAAGEVASALAVKAIRTSWGSDATQIAADKWLSQGTPDARKQLLHTIQQGVFNAHESIIAEAEADKGKKGMGTTLVGAMIVGGDVVFAQAGDSRAYLVRDGIAMQLTEDHTLLARLLAAGVDVDAEGEGMRFKSMLTNALGIGQECKVTTFVVPVADGDRFLLCSDGITEYVKEAEIGEVLSTMPSPARSAQRLVELALARGGGDNATALVVRVLEAGETARPADLLKREEATIAACPLWGKASPQQRLRALRIGLPRELPAKEKIPAQTLGDRVAWIIVEGELLQDGVRKGPSSLLYPEALLTDARLPDKDGLAVAHSDVRAIAIRSDDFRELCDDDPDLGEILLAAVAVEVSTMRRPPRRTGRLEAGDMGRANTLEMETIKEPVKQPRASTVPPERTAGRARANTEPGGPLSGRAPASSFTELETDETVPGRPMGPMPARKPATDIESAVTLPPGTPSPIRKPATDVENAVTLPPGTPAIPVPTIRPPLVAPIKAVKPAVPAIIPPIKPPAIPAPPKVPAPSSPPKSEPPPTKKPERAMTAEPLPPPPEPPMRTSSPRLHPRGSTPPQSLIVPATERANAEADLDRALDDITGERGPMMGGPSAELRANDRSEPEIIVAPMSEPEISISKLEAAADDGDGGARVTEVVKDTSSKEMKVKVEEDSDAEIVVERDSD